MRRIIVAAAGIGLLVLAGCKYRQTPGAQSTDAASAATLPSSAPESLAPADAARGKALFLRFECVRCHERSTVDAPPRDKQCVGCHDGILKNKIGSPAEREKWRPRVLELADTPSLDNMGERFSARWIANYLHAPRDLRPKLLPTMPRLNLTVAEARDIAEYLTHGHVPEGSPWDEQPIAGAEIERGRVLADAKGCGVCHAFTGAAPLRGSMMPTTVKLTGRELERSVRLAPDLRFARDRMPPAALVRWLEKPSAVKKDSAMPDIPLSRDEARAIAAFILATPLAPEPRKPMPPRLSVLDRKVTYTEVAAKVFHRTCWHCHAEPDTARGDGGPGNTGGFGFAGRRLILVDYASTFSGFVDEAGKRVSLFKLAPDGMAHVVSSLVARQLEEAGETPTRRGMPLGLPAVTPEELQLVESWVAQGKPR